MSDIIDHVSAVRIFPVKALRPATINGEAPDSLSVGEMGFEAEGVNDRDFLIYDPADGNAATARGWDAKRRTMHPGDRVLATVDVDIQPDHLVIASNVGKLLVGSEQIEGEAGEITIFGKLFPTIDQGDDAAHYFSMLLGRDVRLLRADPARRRELPERYRRPDARNIVAGADGMPFLLANEASLAAQLVINEMMADQVPMSRWRANIDVVGDGLGPFGEDYIDPWAVFWVGEVGMYVVKACSRCPVPNVDQITGEYDGAASQALRGRAGQIFTGEKGVFFAQNTVHIYEPGQIISVGDEVIVPALADEPNVTLRSK